MQNFTLETHIGADGILHLDVPMMVKNADLKVTVTLQLQEDSMSADSDVFVFELVPTLLRGNAYGIANGAKQWDGMQSAINSDTRNRRISWMPGCWRFFRNGKGGMHSHAGAWERTGKMLTLCYCRAMKSGRHFQYDCLSR